MESRVPSSATFRTLDFHLRCRWRSRSIQRSVTLHCTGANATPQECLKASNEFSSLEDDSFVRWEDS